jgi:hypothetical protein
MALKQILNVDPAVMADDGVKIDGAKPRSVGSNR